MTRALEISVRAESWPLREAFTIARGSKTTAEVIVVEITDGRHRGRGEAVPYTHYGQSVAGAIAALETLSGVTTRDALANVLPPGAARNAADCAFWDIEAKRSGRSAADITGTGPLKSVLTAFTLSVASPDMMAAKAAAVPHLPLLKLKLAGLGDADRMRAVRAARPDARLIADANESWLPDDLNSLLDVAASAGIEMIEQPLPAGGDAALRFRKNRSVAICADESVHTRSNLSGLVGLYDAVNIKLDKTGGLTEALQLLAAARLAGFRIMIGSMVATSLAVAPAVLLAQTAEWADIDGPLLLATDREPALAIDGAVVAPPCSQLWG